MSCLFVSVLPPPPHHHNGITWNIGRPCVLSCHPYNCNYDQRWNVGNLWAPKMRSTWFLHLWVHDVCPWLIIQRRMFMMFLFEDTHGEYWRRKCLTRKYKLSATTWNIHNKGLSSNNHNQFPGHHFNCNNDCGWNSWNQKGEIRSFSNHIVSGDYWGASFEPLRRRWGIGLFYFWGGDMGNQKVALVPTSLLLPRVVVCTTTSWTSLHYILYLGTVELFPVTTIHNILSIIISLVGILPEYRCR